MRRYFLTCLFCSFFLTSANAFDIQEWLDNQNTDVLDLSPSGGSVLWRKKTDDDQLIVQSIYTDQHFQVNFQMGEELVDARYFDESTIIYLMTTPQETRLTSLDLDSQQQKILFRISGKANAFFAESAPSKDSISFVVANQLLRFSVQRQLVSVQFDLPNNPAQLFTDSVSNPCFMQTKEGDSYFYKNEKWTPFEVNGFSSDAIGKVVPNSDCKQFWVQIDEPLSTTGFKQHQQFGLSDLYQIRWTPQYERMEIEKLTQSFSNILDFDATKDRDRLAVVFGNTIFQESAHHEPRYLNIINKVGEFGDHPTWKIKAVSRSEQQMIVQVETPTMPPSMYFIDIERDTHFLLYRRGSLVNKSQTKAVKIKSRDGIALTSYLWVTDKAASTVLKLQSEPIKQPVLWRFDPLVAHLQQRGVNAVTFQNRTINPTENATDAYTFEQWQDDLTADVASILEYLSNTLNTDGLNICLYGEYFGAVAVLSELIENGDQYKCAIIVNGTFDEILTTEPSRFSALFDDVNTPILFITTTQEAKERSTFIQGLIKTPVRTSAAQLESIEFDQTSLRDAPVTFYDAIEAFIKR